MKFTFTVYATDKDQDVFLAEFVEAGVFASGDTPLEALEMLQDVMQMKHDHYHGTPDEKLGPLPLKQKSALQQFFREALPSIIE